MSKYEPLTRFLSAQRSLEVPMSFAEIESVLGFRLPEKASGIRAWWSNNASNNVMTKAWLAAGYVTERVDMGSRRLVFRRLDRSKTSPTATARPGADPDFLERIRARLGGTVTIAEGVDLTAPTGEVWDAESQ
ncbi:MAG: hypothetical protein SWI22_06915 [Pseudomonadota bacterium]|nr:hypothetical protein [Pseudomonadota bacterium]